MIEKWGTPIPRLSGRKPRTVYVYVPDTLSEDERCPVLYMFDGHNVFFDADATYGKSWGLKEYLEQSHAPLIVVAVDCDHRPPHGRLNEYSPFTFDDPHFGHITGKGARLMDWLCGTLKPMIDARYPTLPERESTFICGSSMGGLMSLFAISSYNEVFSRAAALSPSVWIKNGRLCTLIRHTDFAPGTVVYMDYGSRELDNHPGMLEKYNQVAAALMKKGVYLTSRIIPGGEHCEASWEQQLPFVIGTLTYEHND